MSFWGEVRTGSGAILPKPVPPEESVMEGRPTTYGRCQTGIAQSIVVCNLD